MRSAADKFMRMAERYLVRYKTCLLYTSTPEGLELTLQAALQQGYKIQDVAKKIQQNVSDAVQNMTGLTVKTVNVIVVGLVESKSEDIGNE